MGAVVHIQSRKYEMQYKLYYSKYNLNLKNDEVTKTVAAQYIAKLNHKNHMRNILKIVK